MSFKDKILNNQSPWGTPPGGDGDRGSPSGNGSGSRQNPPSLDDVIRNFQKTINKFSGGKSGGSRPIIIGLIIIALLYVASGLYRVLPDEQGVVLRFGKYVNTTQPGLHYHFPTPFERVLTPKVTKVNRVDVGFRPASDSGRSSGVGNVPEESLMLTGDENIVDINYSVFWVIKDAQKFLFNIQSPVETVKAASETAMREVIAKNRIQNILTEGRSNIEVEVQEIARGTHGATSMHRKCADNSVILLRLRSTVEPYERNPHPQAHPEHLCRGIGRSSHQSRESARATHRATTRLFESSIHRPHVWHSS